MRKLEIPVFVPENFELPEGTQSLQIDPLKKDDWIKSYGEHCILKAFVYAIPKLKYDWPEFILDGTELIKTQEGRWQWEFHNTRGYVCSFLSLRSIIPSLPDPPIDVPIGTAFTKGQI